MKAEPNRNVYAPGRYAPIPLFLERSAAYWTAIWKCWRTVLDWTVLLYIALPAGFIGVGMYRDFMRNPPAWLEDFPVLPLLLAALALLQLSGKFRTFAEPGDGLFLHRLKRWRRGFAAMGYVYGLLTRLLAAAVPIALLSPILIRTPGLSGHNLVSLVAYFGASGTLWLLLADLLSQRYRGWRRAAVLFPAGVSYAIGTAGLVWTEAGNAAFTYVAAIALLAVSAGVWLHRAGKRGALLHEIAVENEAYLASVSWLLNFSVERRVVPRRRRPTLFAGSRTLIRHRDDASRLADGWLKSMLRRPDQWQTMSYFAGVGLAAIWLPPIVFSVIVWLVLPAMLTTLLKRQWQQWIDEPFLAIFRWPEDVARRASGLGTFFVSVPIMAIWGLAVGAKAGMAWGGWTWGAVIVAPVLGYFWLKTVNEFLFAFSSSRKRKE
ncbi:ABC transporter permease [Paenibacillaceae bacterium WGS1546]|uniref:ABC transporter permease n=1 Tax=Cohnella sp. WGS1546 TaxID=3366810 RepID=UPI00372D5B24